MGAGKKMPASIIRGTCAFDSKNQFVFRSLRHISCLLERNKKFLEKLKFVENYPHFDSKITKTEDRIQEKEDRKTKFKTREKAETAQALWHDDSRVPNTILSRGGSRRLQKLVRSYSFELK
jgi:hypothetical protein